MFTCEHFCQRSVTEKISVPRGQPPRVVIRLTADHHTVDVLQLRVHLFSGVDAAIDHDVELRKVVFELVHHLIAQWRHFAVFFG